MKFKSYYWAILAAAAAVVVVLAVTLIASIVGGGETDSPHSLEDLQAMQDAVDYTPQIEAYQDMLKADPNDTVALVGLGDIYLTSGRYLDAADQFNKAVALNAADPSYYDRLGQAYFGLGMVDVALRELQKGLAIDPANQSLLLTLGLIYASTGKVAEARQTLQKAYDVNPGTNLAHVAQQFLAELDKQ